MKKIILFLASLAVVFVVLPGFLLAKTSDNPQAQAQAKIAEIQANNEERKQIREEVLEQLRESIKQRRATREAQLAENRKERIRNYWERLNKRIFATIDRLEKLISRIESRLAKIESGNEDIDTTDINEQLDEAKAILLDARAEKEAADIAMEEVLESQDPKVAFKVIRDEVQKIRRKLIEAHRILVHVIGDIRGLRVGQNEEVTPSVEPTATPTVEPTAEPTNTPTPEPTGV